MAVLTPQQRNILESSVKQARKIAEVGAFNALHGLAVDNSEPFAHMNSTQRGLRNSLRNKARLLGDKLPDDGDQNINLLMYELAYETWHKMLFAKFLEANELLIHPQGVAVSMEDCEEFAKEEGFVDKWDAAASYASKMLPAIFRTNDPLMQVTYATDERIKLEEIIGSLENQIFTANDALGWVYQFWQSEAKAAINASGDKIDGAKLPAVTQLFTEPYMVHFLIDNTLGAWWISRNPGVKPPVKFEYLRILDDGTPAAGKFEGWPDKTAEVTSLDPCMGSGHFVASLFPMFASLRMFEEGTTKEEATDKVITENLHGLELDARCTQIAAFNLALTAWKFCGHYKELPEMNLACIGIAPKGKLEDWVKLVGKVDLAVDNTRLKNGMKMLYEHFQQAPELGSLLDPTSIKADAFTASFEELQPILKKALDDEADTEQLERGVMAAGIAKAGQLLAKKYTLQVTNVPYLGKGRMEENGELLNFCNINYNDAKGDLATVFINRMLKVSIKDGTVIAVMPQNWLFLTSYEIYRKNLLKNFQWNLLARLGTKAFQTPMYDFNVMLFSISNSKPSNGNVISGIDVSNLVNPNLKDLGLKKIPISVVNQLSQLSNPDSRIVIDNINTNLPLLSEYCDSYQGLKVKDRVRLIFHFWENVRLSQFKYIQSSFGAILKCYTGNDSIINWEDFSKNYKTIGGNYKWNSSWGHKGIVSSPMASIPTTLYTGCIFDGNLATIIPKKAHILDALWCFCSSEDFRVELRKVDQKISVTTATLVKIPFELNHWQKVAAEKYPDGLPKPYSNDATQWLFHGHPTKTGNPLQVALGRVLGYRWPAESDTEMELADEAKELIKGINVFDYLSDDDGIFCIPSVNAEEAGSDRLRSYLQTLFDEEWNNQTISQLLTKEGASSSNLEEWLRKEFFIQHCKVFQNRPFIWHIWDGRNDGFSALVNYHMLTKENLSKLIYTYLGDWIRMCDAKKKSGESGAEGLYSAAITLKEKLEAILTGEAPYDIFVRWKPLEQQPIGWEPDLNDGVRLNIRPFVEAGILRSKFNVKWGIDRGKNPPGSPWGEIRDNDKHLSLEEKREARKNNSNKLH